MCRIFCNKCTTSGYQWRIQYNFLSFDFVLGNSFLFAHWDIFSTVEIFYDLLKFPPRHEMNICLFSSMSSGLFWTERRHVQSPHFKEKSVNIVQIPYIKKQDILIWPIKKHQGTITLCMSVMNVWQPGDISIYIYIYTCIYEYIYYGIVTKQDNMCVIYIVTSKIIFVIYIYSH